MRNQALLKIGSIQRSYGILAPLEKIGTSIWHDQYQLTKADVDALSKGMMTDRMYKWYQARIHKNEQLSKQLL